jgi:outer membrane protein assembly factor BamE (lipoprotein component of BamABCDE complex)
MIRFDAFRMRAAVVSACLVLLAACATVDGYKQMTAAEVAKVSAGQSREQVRAALGPPMRIDARNRRGQEVWSYPFYDPNQTEPYRLLWVYFDPATGKVVRTDSGENRSMDPDGGS